MTRGARPLGVAVLVLGTLLGLSEILARVCARAFISYDIEMTRYALELKVRSVNPRINHINRPGAQATLMGVPVKINEDGFRDRAYPLDRTGARRYIFLGDSLLFGWGVEESRRFESLLEAALNRRRPTEIINFGTGNYNTEQEVNLFLEKGLRYKPDAVVVFYFINDAEPTPRASRWEPLGRSRFATFVWSRIRRLRGRLDASRNWRAYYRGLYADDRPGWAAAKQAFLQLKDACAVNGIKLQVVLLPELHDPAHYPFAQEHAKLLAFFAQANIDAFDAAPAFAGAADPRGLWVASDDAHPNSEAHAIIARAVEPFIAGGRHETAAHP